MADKPVAVLRADRPVAVLGLFPSAQALLDAIPGLRERDLGRLEAYTPWPVHGLSDALGLKPSPLGKMVFGAGFAGVLVALLMQWWMSAVDYPVRVGGKAFFSWQAFVPIMFEVMVLFAAFTAGLGMLVALNRLPWFGNPVLRSKAIAAITRDGFALSLEGLEGALDIEAAKQALSEAGGESIEVVLPEANPSWSPPVPLAAVGLVAGCVVAALVTYFGIKWFPVLPPMNEMEVQRKQVAYRSSSFFPDGRGMRLPVEGSVARGHMPMLIETAEQAGQVLFNPLPPSREVLERGRTGYQNACQVCHGALGDGKGSLSEEYKAQPANLHSSSIKEYPDGRLYHVISYGKGNMSGYATDLSVDTRWAVVHYVRALQRSQDAREEDLP